MFRLRHGIAIFAAASLAWITAAAQPVIFPQPLSPRIANYAIDVRYNADTHTLNGHEKLVWHNQSRDEIPTLQFHLYLNGFRNNHSTFMKESGGSSRGFRIDPNGWGFTDLTKITLSTGEDLTSHYRFIHPDDTNADDKTVIELFLPRPVRPGDSVALTIDFHAKLPEPPFARSGAKEEYVFAGQWFPKIGVYTNNGWNCHQYHANSEFFADFGVYDVRITVPEKDIVAATGLEVNVTKNNDGTATHWYHAEDVHDFAWTASPEFVEFTGSAENVKIRVLMQPDHVDTGPRHVAAAETGIRYFHKWYGTYPFPNLTVVDPRRGAGGSGGMEYPTLITGDTYYHLPEGLRFTELVIIHEFGHNYWYHLLASNEFEESWMDEGINTYTEVQILHDAYGPTGDGIDLLGLQLTDLAFQRVQYMGYATLDPTIRKAWEYYPGGYGVNSYAKPGLLLTTLQNYLGWDTMLKIMQTYVTRWSFKHPTTNDFVSVANEVAGQNLDWFFDQALRSNAVLDYSVDRVRSTKIAAPQGFDYTRSSASDTGSLSTVPAESDTGSLYLTDVYVRRLGTFTFPVETEIVFENGEKIREHWDGKELWKKYRYIKPTRLVSATVDPDNKIPLDINLTNNSRTMEPQAAGINRTAAGLLYWIQALFDQPELLNVMTFFTSIID